MKTLSTLLITCMAIILMPAAKLTLSVYDPLSADSLGACQGVAYIKGKAYLYGDREAGVIREYDVVGDTLVFTKKEMMLTLDGTDIINHPTGIAHNGSGPAFIGNSIRLNKEGTAWKAVIYVVDWEGLLRTRTLDGNLLKIIEDDACIQGTRPEYVSYQNKAYVATADYGGKSNEVRLYDPEALLRSSKTSDAGVLVKKFTCGPWVQNLHWIPEKDILVLVQNQIEGRKWRLTFLDLSKSVEQGSQVVVHEEDMPVADELEGFALMGAINKGLAVSSSRKNNVRFVGLNWE